MNKQVELDSRARVYFHQSTEQMPFYYVLFDHELKDELGIQLSELLERQLGEDFERSVSPGGSIYVGELKFNRQALLDGNPDEEGWWYFNRINPEELDTYQMFLSYNEETSGSEDLQEKFDEQRRKANKGEVIVDEHGL